MRTERNRSLEAALVAGLLAAAGIAGVAGGGSAPANVVRADVLFNSILFFVFVLVIGGGLVWAWFTYVRGEDDDRMREDEEQQRPAESSPYEQILAELQGIKLTFESGSIKGNFPKLSRLVRVFLSRLGLAGAREMPRDRLLEAISHSTMSQKQNAMLVSIIERCERGEAMDPSQLDFDPVSIIKDFRYLVHSIEGRPQE